MIPRFTVREGDCFDALPLYQGAFDGIVTDPPYSSGGAFRGDRARDTDAKYTQSEARGRRPSFEGDTRDGRSFALWSERWMRLAWRATREGGVLLCFSDWRQLAATIDAVQVAGWVFRGLLVWDKGEGTRPIQGRPRSQAEYVVFASRGALPIDRLAPILPGVMHHAVRQDDKHHQTGKPVEVMRWLCRIVAAPQKGAVARVLDPFAGSGTTGVAALLEGAIAELVEINAEYATIARARCEEAARTGSGMRPASPEQGILFGESK